MNVSQLEHSKESRPKWFSLDSVLNSPELYKLCSQLGFSPPIWHKTEGFVQRIESAVDETTLERERSWLRGEEDRGTGSVLLTDPAAFRTVLDDAEKCFQRGATNAQNTQEFDEVIQLIQEIRESLVSQKPIQASMIIDLIDRMWLGRNWERLPEPVNERRTALDGVLLDVGLAIERPKVWGRDTRSYSLAKAAQAYAANDWMHTRCLTTLLTSEMLDDLKSSLEKKLTRWWRNPVVPLVAAALLRAFPDTRIWCILLFAVAVVESAEMLWVASTYLELSRINAEIESGFYSGRVLAERLERLNRFRCHIPSILTEVLCKC